MSVWLCIPSARPLEQFNARMEKWRRQGYRIAIIRDTLSVGPEDGLDYDLAGSAEWLWEGYPGYAVATNWLIEAALETDPKAEWFVTGGDDVDPDLNKTAAEIADECSRYFSDPKHLSHYDPASSTFGVMQPTGDRWGDRQGAYIDRVAGSPWIGREFARRMYQGKGPYWPEYTHMGVDEELQAVATKYGVFQQRRDLIHYHDHWGRAQAGEVLGQRSRMPAFLEAANSPEEWNRYKALFQRRAAEGFPGSDPIA